MRKLRLDSLHVESFATGPAPQGRGTVRGHDCSAQVPQDPDPRDTTEGGGSGYATCAATCWNTCAASCNGTCYASCGYATCANYTCVAGITQCYDPAPREP